MPSHLETERVMVLGIQTRFHHLLQYAHEVLVLECGCHPLLVCQLLIDLIRLAMRILFDLHFDPIAWG